MANYYATARTNYFRVKDIEAFKEEMSTIPMEVITRKVGEETLVGVISLDDAGMPYSVYDVDTDTDYEIEWQDIFKKHLQDDEVAVIVEVGNESARYVRGYAEAFNNKGDCVSLSLDNIYTMAKQLGNNITEAEY